MTASVAFSSLEKAQYVELVNDKLHAVRIQDQGMFSVFASALRTLIDSKDTPRSLETTPRSLETKNDGISQCIEDLTEMLKEAEMYATPEHHEEFRSIVRDRVAAKIHQLELLAEDEKAGQTYVDQQEKTEAEVKAHQETMRKAHEPLPDSEAHVVSAEECFRQQVAFFQEQDLAESGLFVRLILIGRSAEDPEQIRRLVLLLPVAVVDPRFLSEQQRQTVDTAARVLSQLWEEQQRPQEAPSSP
jgi:hypothetical protein